MMTCTLNADFNLMRSFVAVLRSPNLVIFTFLFNKNILELGYLENPCPTAKKGLDTGLVFFFLSLCKV